MLLPQVSTLFAERAARLRQLADGNPIADYLQFAAKIVDAQHAAAGSVELQPMDRSNIERSQQFSMPLLPAADHIDPAWQQVLNAMLDTLSGSEGLPEPLQPLLQSLRDLSQDERDTIAKRLLQKKWPRATLAWLLSSWLPYRSPTPSVLQPWMWKMFPIPTLPPSAQSAPASLSPAYCALAARPTVTAICTAAPAAQSGSWCA